MLNRREVCNEVIKQLRGELESQWTFQRGKNFRVQSSDEGRIQKRAREKNLKESSRVELEFYCESFVKSG